MKPLIFDIFRRDSTAKIHLVLLDRLLGWTAIDSISQKVIKCTMNNKFTANVRNNSDLGSSLMLIKSGMMPTIHNTQGVNT